MAVLSASRVLVIEEVLSSGSEIVFLVATVTAAAAASKSLVVDKAYEIECVFLRVTVTAAADGQSNGFAATSAASSKTAII